MPDGGNNQSTTVIALIGGGGKIILISSTSEGADVSQRLWETFQAEAYSRTMGTGGNGKVTAAYRFNDMTADDVVQLLWNGTPKQLRERANEIYGETPMDEIELISIVRNWGPCHERFLGDYSESPKVIADALLAGREVEDDKLWQDIFSVVQNIGLNWINGGPYTDTAERVYALYYAALGSEPPMKKR